MILPPAPPKYDPRDQTEVRIALENALKLVRQTQTDLEVVNGERLIMTGSDDGVRYVVSIVAGALVVSPL